jgi:hypothetical protein
MVEDEFGDVLAKLDRVKERLRVLPDQYRKPDLNVVFAQLEAGATVESVLLKIRIEVRGGRLGKLNKNWETTSYGTRYHLKDIGYCTLTSTYRCRIIVFVVIN